MLGSPKTFNYLCCCMSDQKVKTSARTAFTQYLEDRNLRKTPERFFILDKVQEMRDHFQAEDLYSVLENESFHVSRATVYNTLNLLVDCALVRRLQFGTESAQYEKVEGTTNHLHLVCTHCGKIKEVKDAELTRALGSKKFRGFQTSYFTLYFHGICSKCKKQIHDEKFIRNK